MKIRPHFSLGTIFVVITVFAFLFGWIAWQWKCVKERQNVIAEIVGSWHGQQMNDDERAVYVRNDDYKAVNWARRMFGDSYFGTIVLPLDASPELIEKTRRVFGEEQKKPNIGRQGFRS